MIQIFKLKHVILASTVLATSIIAFSAKADAASPIVNPNQTYSYETMTKDIQSLAKSYPDLIQYKSIGKTPYGRELWAVKLGKGQSTVFFNGSHHAREWLTTTLNMYMIDQYAQAYQANSLFEGYNVRNVLNNTSMWFVPMVNPDGVTLQQRGLSAFPKAVHSALIKMNKGSSNFKRWKANAQGIDLNRQYPANWSTIKFNEPAPSWKNHKGSYAFQTNEAKAMRDFTYAINPEITVSYHSSGRILYWYFHNKNYSRDSALATTFSKITGYSLVQPTKDPSGGGMTDWVVQSLGKPAFTPEIGYAVGDTNLPTSIFSEEWRRNKKIGLWISTEGYKLWNARKTQEQQSQQAVINQKIAEYQTAKANWIKTRKDWTPIITKKNELIQTYIKYNQLDKGILIQKEIIELGFNSKAQYDFLEELYVKQKTSNVKVFVNDKEIKKATTPLMKDWLVFVPSSVLLDNFATTVQVAPDGNSVTFSKFTDNIT